MTKFLKVNSPVAQKLFSNPKFIKLIQRPIRLDFSYHIPYLCGYSQNGKVVYFDKQLKRYLKYRGKVYDCVEFLLVHEYVEWVLIHHFGMNYQKAHHVTTHIESLAVKQAGLNWWVYTKFLKPQIKTAYHASIKNLPKDLDLRPYEDEHERKILQAYGVKQKFVRKITKKNKSLKRTRNKPIDNLKENKYDNDRIVHESFMRFMHNRQEQPQRTISNIY